MFKRRTAIQAMGLLSGITVLGAQQESLAMANSKNVCFMPYESEPHQRTWMAFGASRKIWGQKLLAEVQRNLATIALSIAKYEPVSMLMRQAVCRWLGS